MKKVSIVGFGRFGQVLHRLIGKDFQIIIYDVKKISKVPDKNTKVASGLSAIYELPHPPLRCRWGIPSGKFVHCFASLHHMVQDESHTEWYGASPSYQVGYSRSLNKLIRGFLVR